MEKRFEFETEHENEFEALIRDLNFSAEDSKLDIELKLTLLEYYNDILDKRAERKRFIFNHDLLKDFKAVLQTEKSRGSSNKDEKELITRCSSVAGRFLLKDDYEKFSEGLLEEERLKKRIKILQDYRRQGIRDFETARNYEKDIALKAQQQPVLTSGPLPPLTEVVNLNFQNAPSVSSNDSLKPPTRRSVGVPLDISEAEGFELLIPSERNLCSMLRIQPKTYCNIKEILIAAYFKYGYLKRAQARSLIKIDVNKTSRIYDFFVTAGWIHPEPQKSSESTQSS